jgi:DNA-binding transcriptional LysR family regulator
MRIQSVYVFVKLAENNCDFGVHKLLGIPRSSMWANISDLEKTLGKKLINRKKQGLSFTAAGEEFIPYARKMYEAYEESLVSTCNAEDPHIGGDLIVSTTVATALQWSMESIKGLYNDFPNLRLHIVASDSISREEELSSDVLIRPFADSDNFIKSWYIEYHHGLFASQEYINQMGMPTVPEDLASHRIIGYGEYKFSYYDDINWHLKGHDYGLPKLKPYLTINLTRSIFNAAQNGLGICSLPLEVDKLYDSGLVRIFPHIVGPTVKTFFCIKKSAIGRKLNTINVFKEYFKNSVVEEGIEVIDLDDKEKPIKKSS